MRKNYIEKIVGASSARMEKMPQLKLEYIYMYIYIYIRRTLNCVVRALQSLPRRQLFKLAEWFSTYHL